MPSKNENGTMFVIVLVSNIQPFNVTHTRLTALFPGLPGWAGTRKAKPIWILMKQEIVSGSGINWAICKFAPCSRQTTTPALYHFVFTGRMPFLPPNQQCQSTEGKASQCNTRTKIKKVNNEQHKSKMILSSCIFQHSRYLFCNRTTIHVRCSKWR